MLLLSVAVAASLGAQAVAPRTPLSKADRLTLDRPAPLFPLEPAWTTPLPAPPVAGPAIDDSRVYVALADGTVAAADRDSGAVLWTAPAATALAPVAAGGVVIVAGPRELAALDVATGDRRWTRAVDAPPTWLAVVDDLVLVADGRRVLAHEATTGRERWRRDVPGLTRTPPAVGDGLLAVGDDSAVHLLGLADGGVVWRAPVPGGPGALAVSRDRVYVGTRARGFRALDVAGGVTRWQWRTGGDVAGVRVDGDRVFVTTLDNLVRALDAASGNQQWKATLSTRPAGTPLLLRNLVIVAGVAPRVEGFARKTGAAVGVILPPAELAGDPAVATRLEPSRVALVVATRAGALQAYRPERMMFREPRAAPLTALPGRRLVPEPAVGRPPAPRPPAQP